MPMLALAKLPGSQLPKKETAIEYRIKPTKIVHQQCIPSTCLYFIGTSLNQLSVVFLNRQTLRPCSILDI